MKKALLTLALSTPRQTRRSAAGFVSGETGGSGSHLITPHRIDLCLQLRIL